MLYIVGVHGINHSPEARALYPAKWQTWLNSCGIVNRVLPAPWESTGGGASDLAQILSSKKTREKHIDSVTRQIEKHYQAYLEALAEDPTTNPATVVFMVIGHSMGEVFATAAVERLEIPEVPLIGLGGPLGHPVSGPALEALGIKLQKRNPATGVSNTRFYNKDDNVCAMFNSWCRSDEVMVKRGWEQHYISIAGNGGFTREHADKFNITNPNFIAHLNDKYIRATQA